MDQSEISFFDPVADWSVIERGLPHWSQATCITFVTWRQNDSLPRNVLQRIDEEIEALLQAEGIDPHQDWKQQLAGQSPDRRSDIHSRLFATRDEFLDQGFGSCALTNAQCSATVLDSLIKFDMERYFLTDAIIMPNHCHFLCAFSKETQFLKQCAEWKRYTGRRINEILGRKGEFWQVDQFDHLVRSPEAFEYYRRYIAENPQKANLPKDAFLHFSKDLK